MSEIDKNKEPDYEKIVKDFVRKHMKEKWMSENDFEGFLKDIEIITGITIQSMANDLKQGVENGYSIDFQLNLLKKIM